MRMLIFCSDRMFILRRWRCQTRAVKWDHFKKIFETCAFDFSDTGRLSHRPPGSDDRLTGYRDFCGIDLKFDRRYTPVTTVAIIMYDSKQLKDQAASQGFYKVKDDWKFKGNPLWINFTGFKKLSFQEERSGDDFILIGRQIETGRDQAGTPIVFEGVHILRITPSYLVSMDLPFDVDIPSSTRDNVVNDMIKIVESVHVTASHLPVTQWAAPVSRSGHGHEERLRFATYI
jgi:hypothetical protein